MIVFLLALISYFGFKAMRNDDGSDGAYVLLFGITLFVLISYVALTTCTTI